MESDVDQQQKQLLQFNRSEPAMMGITKSREELVKRVQSQPISNSPQSDNTTVKRSKSHLIPTQSNVKRLQSHSASTLSQSNEDTKSRLIPGSSQRVDIVVQSASNYNAIEVHAISYIVINCYWFLSGCVV